MYKGLKRVRAVFKALVVLAIIPAGSILNGCATNSPQTETYSASSLNDLNSRPLKAACASDQQNQLFGRGEAGASIGSYSGVTAGGFVFSRMLMGLSPALALQDKHALDRTIQSVLENDSDGRIIEWVAPNSGESVVLKPADTHTSFRLVTVPRAEEVGRTPESFRLERGSFVTLQQSALRPSPTISSDVTIQKVPSNQKVEVYGRVRGLYGESWYMVGNDGRAYGYMEPRDLKPYDGSTVTTFRRITGPTLRDPVNATVTCRNLTYATTIGEETMTSCRAPEGVWFSDMPEGSKEGRVACLPINRTQSSF